MEGCGVALNKKEEMLKYLCGNRGMWLCDECIEDKLHLGPNAVNGSGRQLRGEGLIERREMSNRIQCSRCDEVRCCNHAG